MNLNTDPDSRDAAGVAFLAAAGWAGAELKALGQDASTRRYFRVARADGARALLMDAPLVESGICPPEATAAERAALGWNALTRSAASRVDAFVLIAQYLRGCGFRAPEVFAHDASAGFALIEDFGEGLEFARLIERGAQDEVALYEAAASVLVDLHKMPVPAKIHGGGESWAILDYDDLALAANADLYADWLPLQAGGQALDGAVRAEWEAVRDGLIAETAGYARTLTLRDFHAENLLWLETGEIGLLDFQDAVRGWDAWDLVMLIQDARREVSAEAERAVMRRYLDGTGGDQAGLRERMAVLGALNALRVAGVFARLTFRDGKTRYQDFMPRQLKLLAGNLNHPATKDLAAFVRGTTPFVFEGRS